MPGNLMDADTSFPSIQGKSQERINQEILDYLYMFLERMRYNMGNIGLENFNQTEFTRIANIINEPVMVSLKDEAEGLTHLLEATAEGILRRLTDAEGNITAVTETAAGLGVRMENAEGSITSLTATAEGLLGRMTSAEGSVTALSATAAGLLGRMSDAEGNITQLGVTASGLAGRISDAEGNLTTLTGVASGLQASVKDLNTGLGQTLRLGADGVTITNAQGSRLTIDGGQINAENLVLTGCISWGDLDSGVQGDINNRGISASRCHTLIREDLVASPNIAGGKFWNLNQSRYIMMGEQGGSNNDYGAFQLRDDDDFTYFSIFDGSGYISLIAGNRFFLHIDYKNYGDELTQPMGKWDFSQSTVTGLKIA